MITYDRLASYKSTFFFATCFTIFCDQYFLISQLASSKVSTLGFMGYVTGLTIMLTTIKLANAVKIEDPAVKAVRTRIMNRLFWFMMISFIAATFLGIRYHANSPFFSSSFMLIMTFIMVLTIMMGIETLHES